MQVFNYHPIYRQPLKGALRSLTLADLNEVWQLDLRCFLDGEAYERETFRYLLSNPQTIARQIRAELGEMLAFAIAVVDETGGGHLTTLAVAPEYRRRGLARMLMHEVERSFVARGICSVRLEVRVSNQTAQQLYEQIGYVVMQRMNKYYSNGDDGYMMIKVLNGLD